MMDTIHIQLDLGTFISHTLAFQMHPSKVLGELNAVLKILAALKCPAVCLIICYSSIFGVFMCGQN